MSEKVLAFFSSDAREKYKADVFRALALPEKSVLHFRYQNQYVQPQLLGGLNALKKRSGIIFFAGGNDLRIKDKSKRKIRFLSIRRVVVRDILPDQNQDLVNFYLELGAFADCRPAEKTSKQLLTPYLSVSEIEILEGRDASWHKRVELFQPELKNTLFYLIDSVRSKDSVISPKYSEADRESYYALADESKYQVYVSLYDPSGGNYGLVARTSGDEVDLNIPPDHKVGAPRDTSVFQLYTHTLQVRNAVSYSTLSIRHSALGDKAAPTMDLSMQIRWNISKRFWSIVRFGIFSMLGTIGLLAASSAAKDFATTTITPHNWALAAVAIVLVPLAASLLYWTFNKK